MISDEAYEDLIYDGEPHVSPASLPGMEERTISVFTLSKTYSMTGWRAGYVIVPERYRAAMRTVVLYSINGVSTPTQWAALEALSLPDEFLREAREGLPAAAATASSRGCAPRASSSRRRAPRSTSSRRSRPSSEPTRAPRRRRCSTAARVATVPGLVFGPEGEGHLRFSFSVAEDMIAGGVEALAAFAAKELQARWRPRGAGPGSPRKEEQQRQQGADPERDPGVRDEVAVRHERDPEKERARLAGLPAVAKRREAHEAEEDGDDDRRERDAEEVHPRGLPA